MGDLRRQVIRGAVACWLLAGMSLPLGARPRPDVAGHRGPSLLLLAAAGEADAVPPGGEPAGKGGREEAYYHFLLAKGLQFENRLEEAAQELLAALAVEKGNSTIHFELALVSERLGRSSETLEHARAAVEADPQNLEARLFLGRLYVKEGRRLPAAAAEMARLGEEQFRRVLEIDPLREEACLELSQFLVAGGREEEALELLDGFLARDPFSERALFAAGNISWSRKDWTAALGRYLKILDVDPDSIRAILDVADTYRNLDDPRRALEYYLQALDRNPDSVNILLQVAGCHEDLGEADQAEPYLRRALELKPASVEATDALGNLAFQRRRFAEAAGHYRRALELDPGRLVTRFNLARALRGKGEPEAALAQFQEVERAASQPPAGAPADAERAEALRFRRLVLEQMAEIHVELEEYTKALAVLQGMEQLFGTGDLDLLLSTARVRDLMGDLPAALAALQAAEQAHPDTAAVHFLRAEVLFDAGRQEEGRSELSRLEAAASREGAGSVIWTRLAAAYLAQGLPAEAERILQPLIGAEGGTAAVYDYLARARLADGNLEGSLEASRAGRKLFPEDPDLLFQEVSALLRRGEETGARAALQGRLTEEGVDVTLFLQAAVVCQREGRFAMAEEYLQEGLRRFPGETDLLFQRGANFERQGDHEKAEKQFRELLEREPRHAAALNYLGYMLADRGERLEEAIRLIGQALQEEPRNPAFLDSMGWALFKAGMAERAGEYLLEAARRLPRDAVIQDHAGDYYLALGRPELAAEHWRKALDLGAESPQAIEEKLRRHAGAKAGEGQD